MGVSTCAHYWQMLYSSLTIKKKSLTRQSVNANAATLFKNALLRQTDNNWQSCGSGMSILGPNPGSKRSRIRIRIKEFKYF
jgi:hypothetical protein